MDSEARVADLEKRVAELEKEDQPQEDDLGDLKLKILLEIIIGAYYISPCCFSCKSCYNMNRLN